MMKFERFERQLFVARRGRTSPVASFTRFMCPTHGVVEYADSEFNYPSGKVSRPFCLRCLAERVRDGRDKGLVLTTEFKDRLRAYLT